MRTEIYARRIDSKTEGDLICEQDEVRLAKALRNIEGVISVDLIEASLDPIVFPVGFSVLGEYDPSRLAQAVCSNGYSITRTKIKR
jgi:hypothetical protein